MLRRWIIRGLCVLLLALCVAAWPGSYRRALIAGLALAGPSAPGGAGGPYAMVVTGQGYVTLEYWPNYSTTQPWRLECPPIVNLGNWAFHDAQKHAPWFVFRGRDPRSSYGYPYVAVPLWFPVLAAGVVLGLAWYATGRRESPRGAFPVELRL